MKTILKEIPAVVVLWLFTHLRQTGGLAIDLRWTDGYLLVAWLVLTPFATQLMQELHRDVQQTNTAKQQVYGQIQQNGRLYADLLNGTSSFTNIIFEDGSVDGLTETLIHLGLNIVMLIFAPFIWLAALILKFTRRKSCTR